MPMPPLDAESYPPPAPTRLIVEPGDDYGRANRHWQGIPSIARSPGGRLWVTWYTGGRREDNDNYCLIVTSGDNGENWSEPIAVVDPPGLTRAWDPCVWMCPDGRLWWTWTQSTPMPGTVWDGRGGVWAVTTETPDEPQPSWSEPRRLAHGVALNKPVFTTVGEFVLPITLWPGPEDCVPPVFPELDPIRRCGALVSSDAGETWTRHRGTDVDERIFDEPMIAEICDGTLWMLIRTRTGLAESFSMDGGVTWSRSRPSRIAGPSSRFFLGRLASGRLLLVNHLGNPHRGRSHLTAMLSEDDGVTWPHRVLLDARPQVSYPDAVESPDGTIRVVYDRGRYDEKEILMAVFTEEEVVADGVSEDSLQRVVSRLD